MLYKSKWKVLWLILSVLSALSALGLLIAHWAVKSNLYLTLAIALAALFFVFKGLTDFIDSKYCARKDKRFMRTLSYIWFGCSIVCAVIFAVQLIFSLM